MGRRYTCKMKRKNQNKKNNFQMKQKIFKTLGYERFSGNDTKSMKSKEEKLDYTESKNCPHRH